MKNRFCSLFTAALLLILGCHADSQNRSGHGHQRGHHDANAFMHQASTDDLIQRFESEERDAYQEPEKVLAWMGNIVGKTVMDLGAGSGYFSIKLANAGAHVIAADVDTAFQRHIASRIEADSLSNIELRLIPYDDPMLAAGEADKVLVVNTYHHIHDRVAYFRKLKEGLSEEGELLIVDYMGGELPVGPPPEHKIAPDLVLKELKEAGYQEISLTDSLLQYQYLIRAR